MTAEQKKAIAKIIGWLLLLPPVGLWFLWRSPILSRPIKIRVAVYSVFGLIVLAVLFSLLELQVARHTLAESGIDF